MNINDKVKLKILISRMSDKRDNWDLISSSSLCIKPDFYSPDLMKEIKNLNCNVDNKLMFMNTLFRKYNHKMSQLFSKHIDEFVMDFTEFISNEFITKEVSDLNDYYLLYSTLKALELFDFNYFVDGYNNCNILEYIEKINYNLSEIDNEILVKFKDLVIYIYDSAFDQLAEKIITLPDSDVKTFIEYVYGDINYVDDRGSLLHRALRCKIDDDTCLELVKKLLSLGVDPSATDYYKYNIIQCAIYNHNDEDFICKLIEETSKYDYKIKSRQNSNKDVIATLLDNGNINLLKILDMLTDIGFKIDDLNLINIKESKWGQSHLDEIERVKCFAAIKCDFINLKVELEDKQNYQTENNFAEKIDGLEVKFSDTVRKVKNIVGYGEFYFYWANAITENRNKSINHVDGKVTLDEALEALRSIVDNFTKEINNEINEQKNKILNYKK